MSNSTRRQSGAALALSKEEQRLLFDRVARMAETTLAPAGPRGNPHVRFDEWGLETRPWESD
ncbi:MAG: hypothetical protein OXF88_15575 [Rhodobacteraceae bacterium]|nr:hypothetical protein [Paracoccaceae bacterium]